MSSKPVHPAFVHFPIAFLTLAFGLDIANHFSAQLPKQLSSNLPPANDMTRAAFYLISLGLLGAIPAVVTGGREFIVAVNKQGLMNANGGGVKDKFKATIAHAVANDIVIGLTAYIWYTRRATAKNTLAGKINAGGTVATPAAAFAAEQWMVFAEVALMVLLGVASNIGGVLTYNFGFGFAPASTGKKTN